MVTEVEPRCSQRWKTLQKKACNMWYQVPRRCYWHVCFDGTFQNFSLLLSVAAQNRSNFHQVDYNSALLLQRGLNEKAYLVVPDLMKTFCEEVCELKKSLYGLWGASGAWHELLSSSLKQTGLKSFDILHVIFHWQRVLVLFYLHYLDEIKVKEIKSRLSAKLPADNRGETIDF